MILRTVTALALLTVASACGGEGEDAYDTGNAEAENQNPADMSGDNADGQEPTQPAEQGGSAAGTFPAGSPQAGCSDTPTSDGMCDPDDVCAFTDPDCSESELP